MGKGIGMNINMRIFSADKEARYYINYALVIVFAVNAIFLPNDTFAIKKVSLILLLLLNVDSFLKIDGVETKILFIAGFFLTAFDIIWSIIMTGNVIENLAIGYPGIIFLLYFIVKKYNIPFENIIIVLLSIMAYIITVSGILDIIGIYPLDTNPLLMWLRNTDNAMVGKGNHLVTGMVIFLKASPMLVLCIPYFIKKKYFVKLAVCCCALFFTGTRANICMTIITTVICYFISCRREKKILVIFMILIISIAVCVQFNPYEYIKQKFEMKAGSDAVRSGTLTSILREWTEKPIELFTGGGFSKKFYNSGRGTYTNIVELSYWNLLRQVGVIPFFLLMFTYIYPVIYDLKNKRNDIMVIGYLAYLIISYTNPLLYSSTGICAALLLYCMFFRKDEINEAIK